MQSPGQPGSRERRGIRARAGAQRGRGCGSRGRAPAGPPIPGPGPRPQTHCWGRRGVAVRRAGVKPLRLPAGAWHSLASPPTPSSRAGRTLGLQPSGPPATRREPLSRLRSWAGPESSDRAGPSRHEGSQLFMGRPGVLPRPALPSASPEKWGRRQGKSSQSKVGHISLIFPMTAASRDGPATLHPSPPAGRPGPLETGGPKATAPHPTLKQRLV